MSRHDHLAVSAGWLRSPAGRASTIFAGSLITLSALAGCGSSGTSAAPPPASTSVAASDSAASTQADAPMVHIDKFKYTVPVSVAPGEKVSVMNMDGEAHTVTSDSGAFDDLAGAGAGTVTTFTAPSKPGSYPFHCNFHANMHGVLVVK